MASVSSLLQNAQQHQPESKTTATAPSEKKTVVRALRLDAHGREIDEHGNVIVQVMI